MEALLESLTWVRFLTLWGLVAPAIGAGWAYWWAARQNRENKEFEKERWHKQAELDDVRRKEDEERRRVVDLQSKMEKSYSAFLSGGMRIRVNLTTGPPTQEEMQSMISELNSGYQQLLLVASSECAKRAVPLWTKIIELINAKQETDRHRIGDEIRTLRAAFVIEARKDLEDPITRNANPGITIRPMLTFGGFHLDDVG